MGYISFPIESNPVAIAQDTYAYIKRRSPAWVEYDGNLDTWLIQILASQASDLRILASDVPDAIFRYFGATVLALPPLPATQAITHSTWTAIDTDGHLIPAGTLVAIPDSSGTLRGFSVMQDVSILPGLSITNEGEVALLATEAGQLSTDIGHAGLEVELVETFDFVDSVVLTETSAGGTDAETVSDYMNRLSDYMRNLSTRPILAEDYARLANQQPGVFRAVALDGYDPNNDTYFNDRMVTIVGIDQFGLDLPDEVKSDLDTMLQSMREINFLIYVIDPSRTVIDVSFEVAVIQNFSTSFVEASCITAVTNYLSPQNWGFDRSVTTTGATRTWVDTQFVYYNEVLSVLSNVDGVDHVVNMTMGRQGDPLTKQDISLDLPAALTEPGTIDGFAS